MHLLNENAKIVGFEWISSDQYISLENRFSSRAKIKNFLICFIMFLTESKWFDVCKYVYLVIVSINQYKDPIERNNAKLLQEEKYLT